MALRLALEVCDLRQLYKESSDEELVGPTRRVFLSILI